MTRDNIKKKIKAKLDEITESTSVSHPFDTYIEDILDECVKELLRTAPLHKVQPTKLALTRLVKVPDSNNVVRIRFLKWGTELSSGKLTVGTIYIITARTDAEFTTDGAPNNEVGTIFKATGTSVTLVAGNKVKHYVDDFLRIYSVKLPGWERAVNKTITREHPDYSLLLNTYTRAGQSKPVIVEGHEYYSTYSWPEVAYQEYINNALRIFDCYTDLDSMHYNDSVGDGYVDAVVSFTFDYVASVVAESLQDDLVEPLAYLCAAQVITYA